MNNYNDQQKFFEQNGYVNSNYNQYSQPPQSDIYANLSSYKSTAKAKKRIGVVPVVSLSLVFGFLGGMIGMYVQTALNKDIPSTEVLNNTTSQNESIQPVSINNNGTFSVAAISQKVSPSVVGLRVSSVMKNYYYGEYEASSDGSGVIYSSDGYIITNYHVVEAAVGNNNSKVMVYLPDDLENPIQAQIVGYDISMDLALIKIDQTGLPAADFGDSDSINIGDMAVAIGNPGGLEFIGSTAFGVISGLNRTIKLESGANLNVIQTDAAINPGNSGGALVNAEGEIIGINSAKLASAEFEGMGFALPINKVVEVCQRIINNKDSALPYIGIQEDSRYTSDELQRAGYPAGVVVGAVVEGSPAEQCGLQRADIIVKFNGVETPNIALLNNERNKCAPGDTATITVFRDGTNINLDIVLAESMA